MNAILYIEGMSCEHCVKRVKLALEESHPQATVLVDLASHSATLVIDKKLDAAKVAEIIDDAGYTLKSIQYQD
jgi:copper chaperone CopZ